MQNFTNQYSLSKTLRFELIPIGKDGKRLTEEESSKLFAEVLEQDKKIKAAYIALKPVIDGIHEDIINKSLTSSEAKNIEYSEYFEEYKKGKDKKLDNFENDLRKKIGETFEKTANEFANNANKENKEIEKNKNSEKKKKEEQKPIFKKDKKSQDVGVSYLTQAGILKYIENNIKNPVFLEKVSIPSEKIDEFLKEEEFTNSKGKKEIKRAGHLEEFSKFFTYFSGYNQNRENYYVSKEENTAAVATRIVHENLPKFCDNIIQFLSRKDEYLNINRYLKDINKSTQIKDAETNRVIEADQLDEEIFKILKFSECLSQKGIEEYNRKIGHYNFLINLYNQARRDERDFKKLDSFKTLFKQIGCGEKKSLFDIIKYDTKEEQIEAHKTSAESLNLEETLKLISNAGKKYFEQSETENDITIFSLTKWLKQNDNWNGVYFSKAAVDKISDRYFANWHDIKDLIQTTLQSKDKEQKELLKSVATYNKKREEQLKINDAVELSGLFNVLNYQSEDGWSNNFFKESILEEKKSLIYENLAPSQNLINLICHDIESLAEEFCRESTDILKINNYKSEDNILTIKKWLDKAKLVLWMVKYFEVKENKVKGNSVNSELTNMLTILLNSKDADWFNWYDLVRNYLTKKPQDDAKKNKLKLNFYNANLLGGWSDGQEKNKSAVLLKNGNKQYVGVLIERNIFDTRKKNNPIYGNDINSLSGRLILRNLSFKTLSGKGFIRDCKVKYSEIDEPITKLQEFIKKNYIQKYPLLKEVSEKKYTDKKIFDKEIQAALTECYECSFQSINWNIVLKFVEERKMYLFEIYSKDFSETKGDKSKNSNPNLQTKYWTHVFEENSAIQLNGGGEIFFREKVELVDKDKTIHPAGTAIYRRSDEKKQSIFKHDIIKNKRFTTQKYFFHIPVKINYQAPLSGIAKGKPNPSAIKKVNDTTNGDFCKLSNIQFLGIDRGEKHLIYYSLISTNGEIIEQGHFDKINKKNYLQEINEAAEIRRKKQENWQQKGNISNLKDGYISLVIHEIIQKMKDEDGNYKPTFIVLEDLNKGFKRSRQKFEQQVYQKFELALAKKLNYLVDKNAPIGSLGSVSKALQLTPPVTNYKDIEGKKQFGIMLYTRANYTSVTDPVTGWRKTIYLKKGIEEEIKKQILDIFSDIGIDEYGDYFFEYKAKDLGKVWKLWSSKNNKSLERYRSRRGKDKNEFIIDEINAKDLLDKLFANFDKNISLRQQLKDGIALSKIDEKRTAWESLLFVIDLIQQIRNSGDITKKQNDNFLLSPVRNEIGEHFDSRIYENQPNPNLPKDADANGAYNIARKGIIMYEHIKQWKEDGKPKYKVKSKKDEEGEIKESKNEVSDLDLFISDKEWDIWTTNQKEWREKIRNFSSRTEKEKNNE